MVAVTSSKLVAYHVACIASDVVVNVDSSPPAIPATTAQVVNLAEGADPIPLLTQHSTNSTLTSLLIRSTESLTRILPSLPVLADRPLVIHAAGPDLSDALTLRSVVPFLLHSATSQLSHDNAILASKLALAQKKVVLHIISEQDGRDNKAVDVEETLIQRILGNQEVLANGNSESTGNQTSEDLFKAYESAAQVVSNLLGRTLTPHSYVGSPSPKTLLITLGAASWLDGLLSRAPGDAAHLSVSLFRPLPPDQLISKIPESATRLIVLEQAYRRTTKWAPLYLDVVSALQGRETQPEVSSGILGQGEDATAENDLSRFLASLSEPSENQTLILGSLPQQVTNPPQIPAHEASYTKILSHLFKNRLEILNDPSLITKFGDQATRPEFALGRARAQDEEREALLQAVRDLVEADEGQAVDPDLHLLLSRWLSEKPPSDSLGDDIIRSLESQPSHPLAEKIISLKSHFATSSRWIVGSDAWSYDLGSSGLHHLIASNHNVNILLIDNSPYTTRNATNPAKRKKDAGLYAMNHGNVYVASVAVYSSYSQSLQALLEADRFQGPSVVLAYLPYDSEGTPALKVLKETKLAIDAGYWPLYRWDPAKEQRGEEPFHLDSEAVKADLKEFLDRQNHLSQLVRATPSMATELVESLGSKLQSARKAKARQAYDDLINSMEGPPLLILYASDGGTAEKFAKRLSNRARLRGLASRLAIMDSTAIDELAQETNVAFVTSTAGQGEPPQNGRELFRALNGPAVRGDKPFEGTSLKYTVFALGDSHYWPRPEDAGYYNKPGKDLDARFEFLGAERMAPVGLGDDQDADGPQTGYNVWEPLLWKALGVDSVEVLEKEPEPITNENIKIASNYLRGTIAEGLKDTSTGALAPSDGQLTKFHGIYEQDDRDIRDERKDGGLEPAYSFMIRVRMPAGVCTPAQWLAMDRIADERGNGTFKLTTRQTFQFHGVIKKHLKPSIQAINKALLDTIAACGDVNRNVLCSSLPSLSHLHEQAYEFAKHLSEHLLPSTSAYHEIWLDKKLVGGDAVKDFEPLYGPYYLPRKFKIAVAIPPNNDVDIFANDVGFIAIADENNQLLGFNVTMGGGMGVTHSNKKTYPRTADVIGFCTPEQGYLVAEKIMLTQRDNGNRADRKNARLKYTIDRMGLDAFKAEVESRLGWKLEPARSYSFDSNVDRFGWTTDYRGKHHFTMFIENGRVQDEPGKEFKTGLKEIAGVHKGNFRLTANQHLVLADVDDADLSEMKRLLRKHKLDNLEFSGLRLSSSACVAFPTCGLAMAESERYLPLLIDKVETICEENGLRNDSIVMRMTGCPNGCARPYIAEVAFVGKAPGSYLMLLGGGYFGQRLNKIYRENVTEPEILAILGPMIKRYALERQEGERFGDFVIRAGYISATTSGKEWYEGMGGEGEHREETL